ncbi:hypothetical protein [Flavobacterium filum]|uniref:hypothetical protein n=1 Tax=Flavobacterium filum TaxID=370974 RepID=UPI0023F33C48|nr:hypothetical protein [Flavobacterium filum]
MKTVLQISAVLITTLCLFSCKDKDSEKIIIENRSIKDSIKILSDSISKLNTITVKNKKDSIKTQSFDDFTKEFITNGTKDIVSFLKYTENKVLTFDYESNKYIKETPINTYAILSYYFNKGKYSINKEIISYKIPYMPDVDKWAKLHFRKNSEGVYKLYKYEVIA